MSSITTDSSLKLQAGLEKTGPTYTLFDARRVVLATFLGSGLAGGWLMAINYRRLGKKKAAVATFLVGILVTVLMILANYLIPHGYSLPLGILVLFGASKAVEIYQGNLLEQHGVNGGKLASWWTTLGLSIACLALVCVLTFAVVFAQAEIMSAGLIK